MFCVFTYRPCETTSYGGNSTLMLHTVIDYDDANVLASITAAQQFQTYKVYNGNRAWSRAFKPRCQVAVPTTCSSSTFSRGSRGNQWINSTQTGQSVQHYGLKIFAQYPTALAKSMNAILQVKVYLQFRNLQ
jgi:hypothetical protein